jgi:DNA-binding CsgD family transcriptional regulator
MTVNDMAADSCPVPHPDSPSVGVFHPRALVAEVLASSLRQLGLFAAVGDAPPGSRRALVVDADRPWSEVDQDIRRSSVNGDGRVLLLSCSPMDRTDGARARGADVVGHELTVDELAEHLRLGSSPVAAPAHGEGALLLTVRERQVLALVARGCSNADVARELCVSVHTARSHVASVLSKLGVGSRFAAVSAARSMGLLHTHARSATGT